MTVGAVAKKQSNFSKILTGIWDEFVYGGHLISLGPTIIAYIYMKISNYSISWKLLLGIYLITFLVHLIDRYIDIKNDSSATRSAYYIKMEKVLPYILILSVIALVVVLTGSFVMQVFALFVIMMGVFYTIFFKRLTRYILGFKSYYTASIFAGSVIFTAFYYNDYRFNLSLILIYLFFFLRWFSDTIFCDIKDIAKDKTDKLKTFAVEFSKNKLYIFLYVIDILSVLPIFIGVFFDYLPKYLLFLTTVPLYSYYYLILSRRPNADYQKLANVWADGESIVWIVAFVIGGLIWAH